MTLQLLVENAVKHNIMFPKQPLQIEITTTDVFLLIRNILQRKNVRVESNHVGLSNFASKYKLLIQTSPTIEECGVFFTVKLPIIHASRPVF